MRCVPPVNGLGKASSRQGGSRLEVARQSEAASENSLVGSAGSIGFGSVFLMSSRPSRKFPNCGSSSAKTVDIWCQEVRRNGMDMSQSLLLFSQCRKRCGGGESDEARDGG